MKQKMAEQKKELKKYTIIVQGFNILFSVTDRKTIQKDQDEDFEKHHQPP